MDSPARTRPGRVLVDRRVDPAVAHEVAAAYLDAPSRRDPLAAAVGTRRRRARRQPTRSPVCDQAFNVSRGSGADLLFRPLHPHRCPDPRRLAYADPRQNVRSDRKHPDRGTGRGVGSNGAVDGNLECRTDLTHPTSAEGSESFNENRDGDALDRVEVDGARPRDRIVTRLQDDLARQSPQGGGTRGYEGPMQARDGRVS
jgi:hypothetical protein